MEGLQTGEGGDTVVRALFHCSVSWYHWRNSYCPRLQLETQCSSSLNVWVGEVLCLGWMWAGPLPLSGYLAYLRVNLSLATCSSTTDHFFFLADTAFSGQIEWSSIIWSSEDEVGWSFVFSFLSINLSVWTLLEVFRLEKFVLLWSELSFIAYNLVPLKEQLLIQEVVGRSPPPSPPLPWRMWADSLPLRVFGISQSWPLFSWLFFQSWPLYIWSTLLPLVVKF